MKTMHRVSLSVKRDAKVRKKLEKLGIALNKAGEKQIVLGYYFDISEDDPLWPEVSRIMSSERILTSSVTEFSQQEITAAEWVLIMPGFVFGYPFPNLHGEWQHVSFDPEKTCSACGIGREQIAPIHMEKEPNLQDNDFMAINWTFDLFARPEVFEILHRNDVGRFEGIPVVHHALQRPLETIRQLRILKEHRPCIIDDNLVRDTTPCGHVKYNVLTKGMVEFSADRFRDMPDLTRTYEWFGSGHMAFQLVLASYKFVQVYMENHWKGLSLAPVRLLQPENERGDPTKDCVRA